MNDKEFAVKALEILWRHFGADRSRNSFAHGYLDFKAENEWPLYPDHHNVMTFYPKFQLKDNFDYRKASEEMKKDFSETLGVNVEIDWSRVEEDLNECGYIHMDTPAFIRIL